MTQFATLASACSALEATSSRTEMVRTVAGLLASVERREIQPAVYLLQGHIGPQFDAPSSASARS